MDPAADPPDAPIFWMPDDDTSVVLLASHAAAAGATDPASDSDRSARFVRSDVDGVHERRDLGNGQPIQLMHWNAASGIPCQAALVPLDETGFDRLEAVRRLLADLHDRVVPPDTRLTPQQRQRARRMLQAFDGASAGATQREIAQAVFRIGPLSRDEWQAASARHAVMSLLRDARALIAGGYRKLLRHRRRP